MTNDEDVVVQHSPVVDMITNPFRTMQGFIEYLLALFFTRQWTALLGFLPVLLVLLTICGLTVYGWTLDKNLLLDRYAKLADAELNEDKEMKNVAQKAPTSESALMKVEGVSPYGEMLLRRMLQLEKSDSRFRYLIAVQIGKRGRVGQARQMMRQVAPEKSSGFAPAHAWLAVDRISQGPIRDKASKIVLLNDLENAAKWSGTGPALRVILAELLESEGRIGDAIKVLEETAGSDTGIWVKMVSVAMRNGRKQPAEAASTKAKEQLNRRIGDQSATSLDYVNLANLWLLDQKPDEAIKQIQAGLQKFPSDRNLQLALSECYRIKYLLTFKTTAKGIECDLEMLDLALKADPTNPAVSEEVARLLAQGGDVLPTLREALEKQLAEGKSTTMTHLLLATRSLRESEFEAAIPHLEVALRQTPNSPVVLNNLALALIRVSPDNTARAREMIERALKISGPNPEILDSQGEVRMACEDYVGAVESFEAAIGFDAGRIGSRKRLVEAYEKAGMKDMVPVQTQKILELEAALKAARSKVAPPATTTQESTTQEPTIN